MASTIQVDKIQDTGGNTILSSNSTGTFTYEAASGANFTNLPVPTSGIAASAIDSGTLAIARGGTGGTGGGGKIGQVLSTTKLDPFATTSGSLVDITGMTVDITPSAASSKILVLVSLNVGRDNNNTGFPLKLLRDTTEIGSGTAAGSRQTGLADFAGRYEYTQRSYIVNYLDSPSTTSATTYKLQTISRDGSEIAVNSASDDVDAAYTTRTSSTITVMEVLA